MKCPKCGSERIQFGTNTSGGGFSFLRSWCGSIILGPLGVLCGACGSDTKTEEFWICQDCGHKFSTATGQYHQEKEAEAEKEAQKKEQQYQQYKSQLRFQAQSYSNIEDIRRARWDAHSLYTTEKRDYKQYLSTLKKSRDFKTRRLVKKAGTRKILRLALCCLSVPIFVLVDPYIALIVFGLGIVCGIVANKQKKSAESKLCDMHQEFRERFGALKKAEAENSRLYELLEKAEYVEEYERKHNH